MERDRDIPAIRPTGEGWELVMPDGTRSQHPTRRAAVGAITPPDPPTSHRTWDVLDRSGAVLGKEASDWNPPAGRASRPVPFVRQRARVRFLVEAEERTGGSTTEYVYVSDVAEELGMDREVAEAASEYLDGEGLIDLTRDQFLLTHEGRRRAEELAATGSAGMEASAIWVGTSAGESFTPQELGEVRRLIATVEELLLEAADAAEDRAAIRQAMAHARDAATRNGRRDWYFLFLGALSDLSIAVAFDPDRTHQIWRAVSGFVRGLLAG